MVFSLVRINTYGDLVNIRITTYYRAVKMVRKAKHAERRGRKATDPRFLKEAMDDFLKDPKICVLPQ